MSSNCIGIVRSASYEAWARSPGQVSICWSAKNSMQQVSFG